MQAVCIAKSSIPHETNEPCLCALSFSLCAPSHTPDFILQYAAWCIADASSAVGAASSRGTVDMTVTIDVETAIQGVKDKVFSQERPPKTRGSPLLAAS